MVNRGGWVRIVEAMVALLLIFSTILILYGNGRDQKKLDLTLEEIVKQIRPSALQPTQQPTLNPTGGTPGGCCCHCGS